MSRGEVGSNVESLHRKWSSDTDYLSAYEELGGPEFEIARAVILARQGAGLTQGQLAKRMNTTQSVIARLEGGRTCPSTTTPMRFAQAKLPARASRSVSRPLTLQLVAYAPVELNRSTLCGAAPTEVESIL